MNKIKTLLQATLIALLAHSAAAALSVEVVADGVRVSGIARGGRVVCSFNDRAPHDTVGGTIVAADSDNDGEVRVTLPQALSNRAVWVVVDFETGDVVAATQAGEIAGITFHGHSFRASGNDLKQLESRDFEQLDVLLVRPRAGAWTLRGSDGGPGDSDGRQDRTFVVDVESLQPLATAYGPPPKRFEKGDVVVLVDPDTSTVFMSGVGK
jgi:hypothetical protein